MRSTPWTPDHDAYLLAHADDNREDLSRYLGRTKAAISERLRLLRGGRKDAKQTRYNYSERQLGTDADGPGAYLPTPEQIKLMKRAIRSEKGEAPDG